MLFEKQILIQREYGAEQYENSASEPTGLAAANDSKGHEDPFPRDKADRPVSVQLGDLRRAHGNGRGAPKAVSRASPRH
jgi:hypothetical protein